MLRGDSKCLRNDGGSLQQSGQGLLQYIDDQGLTQNGSNHPAHHFSFSSLRIRSG